MKKRPKVAIVMGSDSDFPVVKRCIDIFNDFCIEYDIHVISAHRTPYRAEEFAKNAEQNGFGVIIGAAGKAAHLPGVLAAFTCLPVIGLPIKSSTLDGLDSLLSIVQMPKGIPVATVAIDGAENAALLAIQILSTGFDDLREKIRDYKLAMEKQVEEQDAALKAKIEATKIH